jgi:hypothetical protein
MSKVKRLSISRDKFSAKMKSNNKGLQIVVDIPENISQEIQEDLEPLLDFFLRLKKKTEYKVVDS